MPKLDVPEDKLVTTLYVGNLADKVSEKDLRYVCQLPYQASHVTTVTFSLGV